MNMTQESLKAANELQREIERIDDILKDLRPYMNETTILEITIKKQLMNCTPTPVRTFRLNSNNPLWLAIGSSLIDLKTELQGKFDRLDSNSETKRQYPIEETSFWKKVWKQ